MNLKSLVKRLEEETVRVENFILLAGIVADRCRSLPDAAEIFFEDDFSVTEGIFGPFPEYVKEDMLSNDYESLKDWLFENGKFGYLLQVATPVMTWSSESSASYSWGHYTTKWVYAETLEDAIEAGFTKVSEQRSHEKMKLQAPDQAKAEGGV